MSMKFSVFCSHAETHLIISEKKMYVNSIVMNNKEHYPL